MKEKESDPDTYVLKSLDGTNILKGGKLFNPGFDQLKKMANDAGIPLYVCLHADRHEVENGEYNWQGKEIIEWCHLNGISPILELQEGLTKDMFRDGIHPNDKGQRFEAEIMNKYIKFL